MFHCWTQDLLEFDLGLWIADTIARLKITLHVNIYWISEIVNDVCNVDNEHVMPFAHVDFNIVSQYTVCSILGFIRSSWLAV
jgi:hypothetical protein